MRHALRLSLPAQTMKDIDVEEVHGPENEQDPSNLLADQLDRVPRGEQDSARPQSQGHISHIHEIEAHYQQMVHLIGQLCIPVKRID
jgi:hypothetical protein